MKREWNNETIATLVRMTRDASQYNAASPTQTHTILTRIAHAVEGCPNCQSDLMDALDYSDDIRENGEGTRVPSGGSHDVH